MSQYAEKMQYRIMNIRICMYVRAKKHAHDQQKNIINKKMAEYAEKMQHRLCVMPFLEVTIPFNQHFIIGGNTVGKSPTRILTLFVYS